MNSLAKVVGIISGHTLPTRGVTKTDTIEFCYEKWKVCIWIRKHVKGADFLVPQGRTGYLLSQVSRQLCFERPRIQKTRFLESHPSMYSQQKQYLAKFSGDSEEGQCVFLFYHKENKRCRPFGLGYLVLNQTNDNLTKHPQRKTNKWVCLYNFSQHGPGWKCFVTWNELLGGYTGSRRHGQNQWAKAVGNNFQVII